MILLRAGEVGIIDEQLILSSFRPSKPFFLKISQASERGEGRNEAAKVVYFPWRVYEGRDVQWLYPGFMVAIQQYFDNHVNSGGLCPASG
jgi:hypothetical protein